MKNVKPSKWPLLVILAAAAALVFFFYRMYRSDIQTLKGFMASYEDLDRTISSYLVNGSRGTLGKAAEAVIDLEANASLRLSSLIRNDAELMSWMREVAGLSRQEIDRLQARDRLSGGLNPAPDDAAKAEELAKECTALREKRKAAYARFSELGGQGRRP
jgi:hypothetical protein